MALKVLQEVVPAPFKGLKYSGNPLQGEKGYALEMENWICRPQGPVPAFDLSPITAALAATSKPQFVGIKSDAVAGDTIYVAVSSTAGAQGIYTYNGLSTFTLAQALASNPVNGGFYNLRTAAGAFVYYYDGVNNLYVEAAGVWAASAITVMPLNTVVGATAYRRRMYFLEANTLGFWYLPADAVAGAATFYNAGTMFTRGGYAVAINVLTMDNATGPDDYLVVYSSEGEVCIFNGSDPAATSWQPLGCLYIGKPANKRVYVPEVLLAYGGDVYAFTQVGIVSIRASMAPQAVGKTTSISEAIDPALVAYVSSDSGNSCKLFLLRTKNLIIVNLEATSFILDLFTGGWTKGGDSTPLWGAGWMPYEATTLVYSGIFGFKKTSSTVYRSLTENPIKGYACKFRTHFVRSGATNPVQTLDIIPYLYVSGGSLTNLPPDFTLAVSQNFESTQQTAACGKAEFQTAGYFSGKRIITTNYGLVYRRSRSVALQSPGQTVSYGISFTLPILGTGGADASDLQFWGFDVTYAQLATGGT